MPSAEQRPIELNSPIQDAPANHEPDGRKTSLIYGSVEMMEVQSRLVMNRMVKLGSSVSRSTLELYPVEHPVGT